MRTILKTQPMASLRPGDRGLIRSAPGSGRLADLGFVPGTEVVCVRTAPLGDPVEFELRGFRICLRSADLVGLEIERVEASEVA